MATYFHGASEIQPEGLQTLYLMNPGYVGYSDSAGSPPENMVFLNSGINHPMSLSHSTLYSGQPPPPQHFVGNPLQSPAENSAGRFHYNIWSPPPPPQSNSFGRAAHQQGLSLSLSSHQTPPYGYRPEDIATSADEISPAAPAPAGLQMQSVLMNSKYLMSARELLDEMASVSNGGGAEPPKQVGEKSPAKYRKEAVLNGEGESCVKRQTEPTAGERQDLQMKKAKLHGMLDEVEQRYRQYNHQMRIVVSSFEAVAGHGSAKTYTALALQTISKQFRCLRDTISGQITAVGKSLGEEECAAQGEGKSMGSRLRLVDHQLRQQRALQQLGMMQPNGWRPQRGLPERAVSILRAWLFEHFLHPYPKDSDKLLLAKQTGLTRSQVSNWFINARVRLWKPMVEEMYVEEIKDQEKNNNHAEKRSYSDINDDSTSKASSQTKTEHPSNFTSMKNNNTPNNPNPSKHAISETHDEEAHIQPFSRNSAAPAMKSPEISSREILMKFNGGSFGAYAVEDSIDQHFAPRFHGNGVSLTLGLPHCESMSFAGSEPAYLSGEGIAAGNTNQQASSHVSNSYGRIEIQNRKRFAAQLLPDFVA